MYQLDPDKTDLGRSLGHRGPIWSAHYPLEAGVRVLLARATHGHPLRQSESPRALVF